MKIFHHEATKHTKLNSFSSFVLFVPSCESNF